MRVAIAQFNPVVGDLRGNAARLLTACFDAQLLHADLVVAPELAVCGYPPKDLLDCPQFVKDCLSVLQKLACDTPIPLLTGAVVGAGANPFDAVERIANGAVLLHRGEVLACHHKNLLPNYDVFDESRYFTPGHASTTFVLKGHKIGVSVCEDIWNDKDFWPARRYEHDPVEQSVRAGAEFLINLSASPYHLGKPRQRLQMLEATARRHRRPILYVNQVGGNDSLIFDGRSTALHSDGTVTLRADPFKEVLAVAEYTDGHLQGGTSPEAEHWEEDISAALCMGVADYLRKCGQQKVIVGLSGGIDSAVVAALAVRALGPDKVIGVAMPSRYSSAGALSDAQALARALEIRLDTIAIEPLFVTALHSLQAPFAGLPHNIAEENLQSRARGMVLMAYANKFDGMVLSTGNKSEISVGYCTLYGDMCGGLSPISDLYKMEVYALGRYLNAVGKSPAIPANTFEKAPSAELRADQKDLDSLPPYPVLDAILRGIVEQRLSHAELYAAGHQPEVVGRVFALLQRSEYKRRQMAPGLRISAKAFGEGRRLPVAHNYVPS